ncbi:MAG: hypothetical protein ABGY32_13255 [bacterium]
MRRPAIGAGQETSGHGQLFAGLQPIEVVRESVQQVGSSPLEPAVAPLEISRSSEELSNPVLPLIDLPLPVNPLLDADATKERYSAWYGSCSHSYLINNRVRLQRLLQFGNAHKEQDLTLFNIDPQMRRMLADLPAMSSEVSWLAAHLRDLNQTPFLGPLPVQVGDEQSDFERQLLSLDLAALEVIKIDVEHAFAFEKARLVEACFQTGMYRSVLRARSGFG